MRVKEDSWKFTTQVFNMQGFQNKKIPLVT